MPPPSPGLTEPVRVNLGISPDGVPFAIDSEIGLPDAVVQALSQYRFRSQRGAYGVSLTVAIPRPFEDYTVRYPPMDSQKESMEAAKKLDRQKARRLEEKLKPGPASLEDRATLIAYGTLHGDDPEARQIRARQLAWLVLEEPGGDFLRRPNAFINAEEGPGADPQGFASVRQAWLDAIRKNPTDRGTVDNATRFLLLGDPLSV